MCSHLGGDVGLLTLSDAASAFIRRRRRGATRDEEATATLRCPLPIFLFPGLQRSIFGGGGAREKTRKSKARTQSVRHVRRTPASTWGDDDVDAGGSIFALFSPPPVRSSSFLPRTQSGNTKNGRPHSLPISAHSVVLGCRRLPPRGGGEEEDGTVALTDATVAYARGPKKRDASSFSIKSPAWRRRGDGSAVASGKRPKTPDVSCTPQAFTLFGLHRNQSIRVFVIYALYQDGESGKQFFQT